MTNRELLATPDEELASVDRQRRHCLHVANLESPCPACQNPLNLFVAAGIGIDEFDFGATPYHFSCPGCRAELEQVVPVVAIGPPWHWTLKPDWLRSQLEKAKAWDEQHKEKS